MPKRHLRVLRFKPFVGDPITSQFSIRSIHIVNPDSLDAPLDDDRKPSYTR